MDQQVESTSDFSKEKTKLLPYFAIFFFVGIAADQLTKHWARTTLVDSPKMIGNIDIGLSLAFNSGSAFSLFKNSTLYLTYIGCVIFVFLIVLLVRSEDKYFSYAYILIATGAAGNLIDRFTQDPGFAKGYVTDFIKFLSWPIFNIADSFITLGVICLVFAALSEAKRIKQ